MIRPVPSRLCSAALLGLLVHWTAAAGPAQPPTTPEAAPGTPPTETAPAETPAGEPGDDPNSNATRSLPKLAEMPLPTAEDLLRGPRLDWVVLKDEEQHVLVTEPVLPRPATLAQMQVALEEKLKERKTLRGEELDKFRKELDDMAHIKLEMPSQLDEAEYQIHMDRVGEIIHHEDLMLRRIDVLIEQKNFELGYELLNTLRRNTPDWPGAAERHNQFLFAEAVRRKQRGEHESALATLEEIYDRNPTFRGVPENTGQVIDQLVERAIEQSDWRRARHFINRLKRMYSNHPSIARWEGTLNARAEQQLSLAEQARGREDHASAAQAAEAASLTWPNVRNLRARHRVYADRYQRLHVGVLDLPSQDGDNPLLATRADQRASQLQTLRFFDIDNANDGSAHYASRFCDRWEPLNLGREAVFELRRSRQPWEMQPVITAPTIAAGLARRLDPHDALYDERLASYATSVAVDSPYSFQVHFRRVPVRVESLLTIPVADAASVDARPTEAARVAVEAESPVSLETEPSPRGGFQLVEQTASAAIYHRALPEPAGQRLYHLTEIHEHRYATSGDIVQAVLRGDVSLAPSLPPRHVERLRSDAELQKSLFVEKMALPQTHVIQLNPRSAALRNREFRRALMYAIDREQILAQAVLEGAPADLGRVVTSPFPSTSYANSALAVKRAYDPVSAISLALAARKQLGGTLPPLRLIVVDEPVAQAAARKVIAGWKQFGIDVTVIPPPGSLSSADGESVEWDLLYRTVQLLEPVVDLWPFLTLTNRAQVSDLDPFPDWLRQEIIKLDLIGDWSAAVQATKRLHLQLWSEVTFIPLWEVDQYLVYRKNIRGVPVSPVRVYDEVDRWVVEAWYPADEP